MARAHEVGDVRPGRQHHNGWSRRDVLRAGLVGTSALAIGGLGGFGVGRATAPTAVEPHPMGRLPSVDTADFAFPIVIGPDKRSLVDSSGRSFFYLADTAWNALSRMTIESFEALVKARLDRGFSALQMSLLDMSPTGRNAYDQAPFAATGALGRPAVATDGNDYWGTVDRMLDICESNGVLVSLVPCWYGGWGDSWRGYVTPANAAAYGRFLSDRFGSRPNLWWLLGGDNSPSADGEAVQGVPGTLDRGPRVAETIALGTALYEGSEVKPLMSYHTARTDAVEEFFGTESWYQLSAAYSGADPVPFVTAEYRRQTVRPVVLWEAYYDERTRDPILDRTALRAQAYHALLSGAVGFSYGHEQVWPVLENWMKALEAPSARDVEIFSRVVRTHVTGALTPVLEGDSASRLLPAGYGAAGTTSRISAGLMPENAGALVYVGEPRSEVVVDTTAIDPKATFDISWIDPGTGEQFFFGEDRAGSDVAVNWPSSWVDAVMVLKTH